MANCIDVEWQDGTLVSVAEVKLHLDVEGGLGGRETEYHMSHWREIRHWTVAQEGHILNLPVNGDVVREDVRIEVVGNCHLDKKQVRYKFTIRISLKCLQIKTKHASRIMLENCKLSSVTINIEAVDANCNVESGTFSIWSIYIRFVSNKLPDLVQTKNFITISCPFTQIRQGLAWTSKDFTEKNLNFVVNCLQRFLQDKIKSSLTWLMT